MKQAQIAELTISAQQLHWTNKLLSEKALAPKDVKDKITQLQYDYYNNQFDKFSSDYVQEELVSLAELNGAEKLAGESVTVVGLGLGRGLGFIPYAVSNMGMHINLIDFNQDAIKLTQQRIELWNRPEIDSQISIFMEEIDGRIEGQIPFDSRIIVMSQFLQILPTKEDMQKVMASLSPNMTSGCRLIIIHPFRNPDSAGWGDTKPYTPKELCQPLAKALGSPIKLIRSSNTIYFGYHNYTAFTFASET